ncbi:MAG: hypothetical protein HZA16_13290 [Nitrospirae bacterium]|nr:hypothetical protein [Nitrospirota bacterium]
MCMDYKKECCCGSKVAGFNLRDGVMPVGVVSRLYCPECSKDVAHDPETMVHDNGWIIEYDMDAARFMGKQISVTKITPDFLFDEGYCTWRGTYPTDHIDSVREREEIIKLAKTDPKRYFAEIRRWGTERMDRLAAAGWRKANEREQSKV